MNEQAKGWAEIDLLRRQLTDSRKSSAALQQMVDAFASLHALEEFVPEALRIVARAFESRDCAYYEHRRGHPIRLRHWFLDGKVFGPDEIRSFGREHGYAGIKLLEAGFHVPDTYLGVPFRKRARALVLNHGWDDFEAQWEELRRQFGWYTVLNVPLIIDGEADGSLVMNRGRGAEYSQAEIELGERLGQQLTFAIEVDRLTIKAREAAASQHRELAAQIQVDEMAKTDDALQRTTDALAAMPDLDNFIPAALQIVATAFNARDCAYYEHRRGELIRLRYWFFKSRVLSPDDIARLDPQEHGSMRRLAVEGFTVPDSYLGVPFRQRTRASVVDHTTNDPPSVFDENCNARGWELELNVPLVVAGEADGALIIYRRVHSPFTAREISLAERLGQQLALAMEASRLSAAAKNAAVGDERERAARMRAAELSRHAALLTQTIDSLVEEKDFPEFIGRLLGIACSQLQAPIAEYWADEGPGRTRLELTFRDGVIYKGSDDVEDVRTRGIPTSPEIAGAARHRDDTKAYRVIDMLEDRDFQEYAEGFGMRVDEWCRQRSVRQLIILPLLRNEVSYGSLCVYFPVNRTFEQPHLDLAFSLAQQVSLAVRMTELAEESKQSALSRAGEAAANDRARELSKANDLLRSTLERLSDERDLRNFPQAILRVAMDELEAHDGFIFLFDGETKTLSRQEMIGVGLPMVATEEFSKPFPVDAARGWLDALAARSPKVYDVDLDEHMLLPGAAEWHRKRGTRSVVVVPMFMSKSPYGFFAMGLTQPAVAVSMVDLGLAQALTQQASLAIQLTRLADESKQAALAQERERKAEVRAAEFANANEVLRSTLDQLSEEHDLHSFPRTILNEAMSQAGASDGLILLYDKLSDTLNRSVYISAAGSPPGPELAQSFPASRTPAWLELVGKRSPVVFDVERDAAMLLPGLAAWHHERGNRSIIAAAMFIDLQPYGYFGITLHEPASEVSQVKTGLIHALSQQATLAIQLTNLAEASQQAAITVERQRVVIEERANMAREIHDRLAQGYAAILMQQHTMRRSLMSGDTVTARPLLAQLDIIERLSKENLAEARSTIDELRIDPLGLVDLALELELCVSRFSRDRHFAVSLDLERDLPSLRRHVQTELCRIVVEAITNSRNHSRSMEARVSVRMHDASLSIAIRDDGVGFDVDAAGQSFGITGMKERAGRAGASIQISSSPGCGTEVLLALTP